MGGPIEIVRIILIITTLMNWHLFIEGFNMLKMLRNCERAFKKTGMIELKSQGSSRIIEIKIPQT